MNKLILALPLLAIFGIACASTPPVVEAPEPALALGEPGAMSSIDAVNDIGNDEHSCKNNNGVWCSTAELCCPKNYSHCPPAGSVYPANQVCSKREQK